MEDLQSSALPLGYAATARQFTGADSIAPGELSRRASAAAPRDGHGCDVGLERERGFEPPTSTLARLHSTTELLPLDVILPVVGRRGGICHAMPGPSRGVRGADPSLRRLYYLAPLLVLPCAPWIRIPRGRPRSSSSATRSSPATSRTTTAPGSAANWPRIGVEVGIALTLPDDELLIAGHLRRTARRYAPVFVTGGIGTTLDDVTRQAVARAAGVPLIVRADVVARPRGADRARADAGAAAARRAARGVRADPEPHRPRAGLRDRPVRGLPRRAGDAARHVPARRGALPPAAAAAAHALHEPLGVGDRAAARGAGGARARRRRSAPTRRATGAARWVEIVLKSRDAARLDAAAAWLAERLPGQPAA